MTDTTSAWANAVAGRFTAEVAHVMVAFDPDRLLAEETILSLLAARGFDVVWYEDPIKFRYVYESQYRESVEGRRRCNLLLVLPSGASDQDKLPFDIVSAAECVSLSLGELFPELNYPVVEALDSAALGALYEAVSVFKPSNLGELATKDFVLKHVFEVVPELIKQPSDMLRFLARRHYRGLRLPALLDQYIIDTVRMRGRFSDWPLEQLLPDRQVFFAFLQERWPIYLDQVAAAKGFASPDGSDTAPTPGGSRSASTPAVWRLAVPGPADLPFGHDDVHVYIDDLFYAGLLTPVEHPLADRIGTDWMAAGLVGTSSTARSRNLEAIVDHTALHLPGDDARHADWVGFALEWAELLVERWHPDAVVGDELSSQIERLVARLDEGFTAWVLDRYSGLHSLASSDPVMVHHVPRVVARETQDAGRQRAAVVVVDGMSLDQWLIIREALGEQLPGVDLTTTGSFAWAPTLTSVSRQALFAGEAPQYFAGSILSTAKELALWASFWAGRGLAAEEVGFEKGLGEEGGEQKLAALLAQPKLRVVGIVVNAVDNIMHGATLGTPGVHGQVRQWAKQGHFAQLLSTLLDENFAVYVTADHGNVEARGIGSPAEKSLADLRGERVRVYPNATLRDLVAGKFPSAIPWDAPGLPEEFVPLIASGRDAFITQGKRSVTHGGIALEELVVPFVRVTRKEGAE